MISQSESDTNASLVTTTEEEETGTSVTTSTPDDTSDTQLDKPQETIRILPKTGFLKSITGNRVDTPSF